MQIILPQVTSWVVHLAPIGVCFLIAGEILHMKSVLAELTKLAWCVSFLRHLLTISSICISLGFRALSCFHPRYLITVCLGITTQGFIILPIIYSLVTRKLPFRFEHKLLPWRLDYFNVHKTSNLNHLGSLVPWVPLLPPPLAPPQARQLCQSRSTVLSRLLFFARQILSLHKDMLMGSNSPRYMFSQQDFSFFEGHSQVWRVYLSSPKDLRAESARAVTGRRRPHSALYWRGLNLGDFKTKIKTVLLIFIFSPRRITIVF